MRKIWASLWTGPRAEVPPADSSRSSKGLTGVSSCEMLICIHWQLHTATDLQESGETPSRVWQPRLGALWEDQPEAFREGPAQGDQTSCRSETLYIWGEITNPQTLYFRCRRGDMIAVYQLFHGGMSLDADELLKRTRYHATRGHEWKLDKSRVRTASRKQAFSVRVVKEWNSLPAQVVSVPTLTV